MKFATPLLAALSFVALGSAHADTRNSDKGATTMEQKASPSNPGKQDEERMESHSQPDTPHPGGTTARNTVKRAAPKKDKGSSSTGSSAPADKSSAATGERDKAFKALDLDGDGAISKAEAAGNAEIVTRFDRADKNRDGKLSRAEFDSLEKSKSKGRRVSAR